MFVIDKTVTTFFANLAHGIYNKKTDSEPLLLLPIISMLCFEYSCETLL